MKAQAELDQLTQAEADLKSRRDRLTPELAEATEARAGAILAATIDGKEPGAPGPRIAALTGELAAIDAALGILPGRRADATQRAKSEEAETLRTRAAEIYAEADKHEERTLQLLAELLEHEGVQYVVTTDGPIQSRLSRTQRMRDEAQGCIIRAKAVERELRIADDVRDNPHHYR